MDEYDQEPDRAEVLAPAISDVITALGGFEGDTYVFGDECYGCLKDIKKFWRKDDSDDDRTVARLFWNLRLLPNDLIPILLETAGKGRVNDKHAIATADIITAMTWPIDVAAELKEIDEEYDKGVDYTHLLQAHLHYKANLLRPGVIPALFSILLPCIAKDKKSRTPRDSQIVNVVLHLFRNLAFIRDKPPNAHLSADQVEFSSLQAKLIKAFSEAHVLDLLITIASNATDPFFNQWNVLVLETFYLLYRGVHPSSIVIDQAKRSQNTLSQLLAAENKLKVANARTASSRHSRFGTTISVTLNPNNKSRSSSTFSFSLPEEDENRLNGDPQAQTILLHRQQGIRDEPGSVLDLKKRKMARKANTVDELGLQELDNLDADAKDVLQKTAKTFLKACFNTFLGSLLKDIRSERPKITEKDHVRLLFLTRWFMEFFVALRANMSNAKKTDGKSRTSQASEKAKGKDEIWDFELVGEVLERGWIVWMLRRMRESVDQKPKAWTELQAGIECLTQLLALIDAVHQSPPSPPTSLEGEDDSDLLEAAATLRQQIVYNGEVLDLSLEALKSYKEGTQSLRYLDASVRLAYELLRMLERWSKERSGGELMVRKKTRKRRKGRGGKDGRGEGDGEDEEAGLGMAGDEEDEDDRDEIIETEMIFTFDSFEARFAHADITHTLLASLARLALYPPSSPASPASSHILQLKRTTSLLHRLAVRCKAEGLFFTVSTLSLFRQILQKEERGELGKEREWRDTASLVRYIARRFWKCVEEDNFSVVEAFFPKNRSRWKQFSSWEPEAKDSESKGRGRKGDDDGKDMPAEVKVKKGYTWSQQLGIAIACLVEKEQKHLVDWVRETLMMVIGQKTRIIEEWKTSHSTDANDDADKDADGPDYDDDGPITRSVPAEAMAKFEDYTIPYETDEKATAATRNPHLKLVFRLIQFYVVDANADELEWYIPAAIAPSDLSSSLRIIDQFLAEPLDLQGKKASSLLYKSRASKKRTRRRRRSPSNSGLSSNGEDSEGEEKKKKKRKKKEKETQVYKSAQFIEDSDVEYGEDEAFWERERKQREKTERIAAEGNMYKSAGMRATGTKKRKKRKEAGVDETDEANGVGGGMSGEADAEDDNEERKKKSRNSPLSDDDDDDDDPIIPSRLDSDSDDEPLTLGGVVDKVTQSKRPAKSDASQRRTSTVLDYEEEDDEVDATQSRSRRPKTKAIVYSDDDD